MGIYLPKVSVRDLALATPLVIAVSGFAQAACYNSGQQLPADTVAQFTADPAQLQSKYPNGGARMVSMVRDLVASDSAMLPLVLDLSANSNADQINAIGAGLGQAALVCSRGDPTFANEIHQMVAAINNQPLALTFAAVIADSPRVAARPDSRAPGAIGFAATPTAATAGPPNSSVISLLPNTTSSTGATGPTSAIGIGPIATEATGVVTNTGSTGPPAPPGSTGALGTGATGAPAASANGSPALPSPVTAPGAGPPTGAPPGGGPTGSPAPSGPISLLDVGPIGAPPGSTNGSPPVSGPNHPSGLSPIVAFGAGPTRAASMTPGTFFTLSFNARGETVTGRTTDTSATWRSVSPSQ
jgi:hypothetical protein